MFCSNENDRMEKLRDSLEGCSIPPPPFDSRIYSNGACDISMKHSLIVYGTNWSEVLGGKRENVRFNWRIICVNVMFLFLSLSQSTMSPSMNRTY